MSQCVQDLPLLCSVTIGTPGKLLTTTFSDTVMSGSKVSFPKKHPVSVPEIVLSLAYMTITVEYTDSVFPC